MATIGSDIKRAIELLKAGELVGIPTETVYGLAANGLDVAAVSKIFEAKNRPTFDPLILHVANFYALQKIVKNIPDAAVALAEKFMPGPLTLLLAKQNIVPDLVTAGLEEVAVRIPNHPLALALLENIDFPLAAPSANPFGYISPTTAQHVDGQLGSKLKYILDGGSSSIGIESTIVGFVNGMPVVYRKGGLAIEAIEGVLGEVLVQEYSNSNPKAPGMLKSHYAPQKKMLLWDSKTHKLEENIDKIAFLRFKDYMPDVPKANQLILSASGIYREAAQNLFAYMRALDNRKDIEIIYAELLPEENLGRAINDRIRRAAA